MKKLIIALLVICLLMAGTYTYLEIKSDKEEANEAEASTTLVEEINVGTEEATEAQVVEGEEEGEGVAAASVQTLDYEALKAYLDEDEVVMTVDGKEITWGEYYYWLSYMSQTAEYYMTMYSYYGMDADWSQYAEPVKDYSKEQIVTLYVLEAVAEENGVELTEEQLQEIEDEINTAVEGEYGEATQEKIDAYLESKGIDYETYMRLSKADKYYNEVFNSLYGEDGSLVSDEDAAAWLEEGGYMYATHILLATVDMGTGEALDEAAVAEKQAQAEEIVKQLNKVKAGEKRVEKFNELKAEYCEDSGKESYPDGYFFLSGDMVKEFEDGYLALEKDYDVSEPVLSSYGYHIIMKLPYKCDAIMGYSEAGTALTAKASYANEKYGELMDQKVQDSEVVVFDCIKNLSILDYLK